MKSSLLATFTVLLISSFVLAQSITGQWTYTNLQNGSVLTLILQDNVGQLIGTLEGNGQRFSLSGRVSGLQAQGTLTDNAGNQGFFALTVQNNQMQFTFGDYDSAGQPDYNTALQATFTRASSTIQTGNSSTNKPIYTQVTRVRPNPQLPAGTTATANLQYKAGARVNIANHNVSFVVPNNFQGQTLATPAGNFTFFSQGQIANVFIWAFTGLEPRDATAWLEYPIELDANLKLEPIGGIKIQQGALVARHTHAQLESLTSIIFSKNNAIGFTVMTTKAAQNQLESISKNLVQSSKFAPSPLENTVTKLRQGLSGRYLLKYSFSGASSGTGGTENQRRWDLCSNGQYAYFGRTETSYSSNNYWAGTNTSFFSTNGANEIGAWRVFAINDFYNLMTISNKGELSMHTLSNIQAAGGKLPFMDGKELGAFGVSNKCQ